MLKIISALFCLFSLVLAVETRAADNLTLTQYKNARDLPASFLALGGGEAMINRSYKDDDNKSRTDKVYYTTTHSYDSTYPIEDVIRMMNPADGRLGNLFEDTTINKSSKAGFYSVSMNISTPLKDFNCQSMLNVKITKSGNKTIFLYTFSSFNMVFTDMVIQAEVQSVNGTTKLKLNQVVAMKGSTYSKLKSVFAVGKFESAMKKNIKTFKSGVGGI